MKNTFNIENYSAPFEVIGANQANGFRDMGAVFGRFNTQDAAIAFSEILIAEKIVTYARVERVAVLAP